MNRRLKRDTFPLFVLLSLFAFCAPARALDQQTLAELLEDARSEMEMPGLRAAVRMPDGDMVRASVGLADKENDIPLNDTVGMPGGSTGKTFVAALTMLLVEDGILSLDDPVSKWLGNRAWFKKLPNAEEMRVRHLLSHTAGIKDYPGTVRFNLSMIGRVVRHGSAKFEPEELIGFVAKGRPLFAPGQGYRYTDAGYLLLGLVIEDATGRDYYELLAERILEPQQLDQVRPADRSVLPDITPGYMGGSRNMNDEGKMKFDPSSEWTGGGLVTNPTMLVGFYAALAAGRIVQPGSLATMLEEGWRDPENPGQHYGFGVFVDENERSFGHGGLWPGYRTQVTHYSESGITVAVQTNRDGRLDMEGLADRIAAAAE